MILANFGKAFKQFIERPASGLRRLDKVVRQLRAARLLAGTYPI
jgi:hypothetical protein